MIENILTFVNNNLFAVITVTIAIIALLQTHKQIKINNKQFLFEKRLNNYLLIKGLLELFKENEKLLDYSNRSDDEIIMVDFQFINLTNNTYLKDITCIIEDTKSNIFKNNFLVKIEELKELSTKIRFVFKGKDGKLLCNFILKYQNTLMELYKYKIIFNLMMKDEIPRKNKPTYNQLQKEYGELEHRYRLYNAIEELKQSYYDVVKYGVISRVERVIKL